MFFLNDNTWPLFFLFLFYFLVTHKEKLVRLLYHPPVEGGASDKGNNRTLSLHQMSHHFMITCNNPIEKGFNSIEDVFDLIKENCKGFAGQLELAPTTGTPHFQCYAWMIKKMKISTVINLLEGCDIEIARSPADAWKYCTDDNKELGGERFTFGEQPSGDRLKRKLDVSVLDKDLTQEEMKELGLSLHALKMYNEMKGVWD